MVGLLIESIKELKAEVDELKAQLEVDKRQHQLELLASQVNTELGRPSTQNFSMNDSAVRALAGRPSGSISFNDPRGKANKISARW